MRPTPLLPSLFTSCREPNVLLFPAPRSIRDRLIESWNDTNQYFDARDVKRVYAP